MLKDFEASQRPTRPRANLGSSVFDNAKGSGVPLSILTRLRFGRPMLRLPFPYLRLPCRRLILKSSLSVG